MKIRIAETRMTRQLEFRIDHYGIYFLAYENDDLIAGISYQYPKFIMDYLLGHDSAEETFQPATNLLSFYNYGEFHNDRLHLAL